MTQPSQDEMAARPTTPTRSKARWVIAAVVLVIGCGAAVAYNRTIAASREASGPGPSVTYTLVAPASKLPTAEEIGQIALLSVEPAAAPYSLAQPDTATSPLNCSLADRPTSKSTWGRGLSEVSQYYADGTKPNYQHTVWVDLAAFETTKEATESLTKIAESVKSCTTRWTSPSALGDTVSSVIAVREFPNGISWVNNTLDTSRPWVCSMAYTVDRNLASSTVICGPNESNKSVEVVDHTLAKATGRS